ncbi:FxLD family lanthipeptide [Kitasatospora sp. HPMI-4]|uniref:FxLD family lanthipeptide n=1 Tax=Kitasatospora sp. HPMI-4 TaxID=3448443 RepID=UPI003F1C76A7
MVQQIKTEAPATPSTTADDFDLDVAAVEVADAASLQVLTDDGCGSTCGACTTGLH